ncbi:ATP-NAD kinase [Haloplanus sp. GCM10025708]|uniref:ATP-NAD kinase n=1 Tax=Haloferacaceae TaxID=1644056 RepID=UPI003615A428
MWDGGRVDVAFRGEAESVERAIRDAGVDVVAEADADVVVAAGDAAIHSLVETPADAPVLPVTPAGGRYAVPKSNVESAVASLAAGDYWHTTHPVLSVTVDGDHAGHALVDVTLMTSAPARISEYAVSAADRAVAAFRADGVVVATPFGSDSYAAAAGGAVLDAGTGLSVVPVAPFSTQTDVWVLDPDVDLSVEREGDVSVYLDGDRRREVGEGAAVGVDRASTVEFLTPDG